MKEVIGKYLYDTNKAERIASAQAEWFEYHYGRSPAEETLYKTKSGRWFLHTARQRWCGILWPFSKSKFDNESLDPMTENEVWHWCVRRGVPHSIVGLAAPEEA